MFVGRQCEIDIIQKAIRSERAELGIVYGRRRIGKSTLLAQVKRPRGDLYFEGLQKASADNQIKHFLAQLAEQTGTPMAAANDWHGAFGALSHHIRRGRRYVVFDEFPWMARGRTERVALLKYFWDNHWKKNPKLTLVLCGSIAAFMLKHIIHSQALHNRKTFEIRLRPLSASEAKLFFGDYRSDFEIAKFLMVFGGIPKYLEQLDPRLSLSGNLDRLCFHRDGFFVTEFDTIFKEQFKAHQTYEAIVRTLADQSASPVVLAERLGLHRGGGLTAYLKALEQADFVKIFTPGLIGRKQGARTKRIVLWDDWLRFYFTYVEPFRGAIDLNTKPGLFSKLAAPGFDAYCGLAFERLCMKNMADMLACLDIPLHEVQGYGPFFRQRPRRSGQEPSGVQIDILIDRSDNVLTAVECKFSTRPIGMSVISEMRKKLDLLHVPRHKTVERVLVSAGETTPELRRAGYFHRIIGLDAVLSDLSTAR